MRVSHIDVAFMPTWRGDFSTRKEESYRLLENLKSLLVFLEENLPSNYTLWVRLHPQVSGKLELGNAGKVRGFPVDSEPYEHLSRCHALVTDYSSVMFDFACTGRPILLYVPDLESYRAERSMYIDIDKLPFSKVTSESGLLEVLTDSKENVQKMTPGYSDFVNKFCLRDDGMSSKKVCDAFF